MSDLISRQTALAAIDALSAMQGRCTSKTALIQNSKIWQQIKDLPSVEPVKHGKWINISENNAGDCSECEYHGRAWMNYCPNCGADMR